MPLRCRPGRPLLFMLLAAAAGAAEPEPPPRAAADDIVQLSPFAVTTSADQGYRAGNSVSGTRIDTPIKDLPFAVSAFTQQFIADLGARDLWDVVQFAPSVTSAGREFNAGNAVYTIRGFEQKPQRNGFAGDAYVDTAAVDRIEVVKGPASVLYGQVAPGGTVNYLTKRARPRAFAVWDGRFGTAQAWRTAVDINQPLSGKTLLARLNAAWENLGQYWAPMQGRTRVLAPNLVWQPVPRVSLNVDYEWFRRDENPAVQLKPNTEIVALPGANGLLGTTGVLARPDNSDAGIGPNYPLPADFNYASSHDWRRSDFESLDAELRVTLAEGWVARVNVDENRGHVTHQLTGLAQVNLTVPTRYYPAGAGSPISAADYALAAHAFADALRADPRLALDAPIAQQIRRQRLEDDRVRGWAFQGEVAGDSTFGRLVRLRPLAGFSHTRSASFSRVRQSGAAGFPNFPVWDMKKPATWDYATDFNPASLPVSTDTQNVTTNSAVYAVVNASLWHDRLVAVDGWRYNLSSGWADNYLAPATSVAKISNRKGTPQIGVGYRVQRDLMLYASYSESFVLNAADLQRQSVPSGPARPTTARGGEVGLKADLLEGRVSSTVAVFRIDQRDRILRFITFDPTGASLNNTLQGTLDRSQGVEAEITWSPLDCWQVYASGAVDDVRVAQVPPGEEIFLGSHPENTAKALANLWTRYTLRTGALSGLWLGAGFNHTGAKAARINNPGLFLPAETIWNATLGYDWRWAGHPLVMTGGIQNVFDREYFPANQQRGFPRRITLGMTGKF